MKSVQRKISMSKRWGAYNDMSWKFVYVESVEFYVVIPALGNCFQLTTDFYLTSSFPFFFPTPSFLSIFLLPCHFLSDNFFLLLFLFFLPLPHFTPSLPPSLPPPLSSHFMQSHGLSCKQRKRASESQGQRMVWLSNKNKLINTSPDTSYTNAVT